MGAGLFLKQMLRDLWSQKLRSALTIFGIVWGTAAISLLLAFGQALHVKQMQSMAGLGDHIVIAWPSRTSLPWQGLPKGRAINCNEEDVQAVRDKVPNLQGISAEYAASLLLNFEKKRWRIDVSGVAPEFGEMRSLIPQSGGRFLDPIDERERRRVAFIGNKLATDVFGSRDPVGALVLLNGSPFQVVGVMKPKDQDSSYSGRDHDKLFIPGSTFRAITGARYADNLIFKASANSFTNSVKKGVVETLAARRRFDPKDEQAIAMWDTTEMFVFFDQFMLGFKLFLGVVGALTLVVGGIGVSNIMHVAVEERAKEIGIKMALGAKPRAILGQFLVETSLITALGGALGLLLTFSICALFGRTSLTEFVGSPAVSPSIAALAAGLLGIIGLIAGWFPAREAARLDPVVAMKL